MKMYIPPDAEKYKADILKHIESEITGHIHPDGNKLTYKSDQYIFRMFKNAKKSFNTILKLYQDNMPVEQPLLLIDKGLPVKLMVTKYIEGQNYEEIISTQDDFTDEMEALGETLYKFHSNGYLLQDTHIGNFIYDGINAQRIDVNNIHKQYPKHFWKQENENLLTNSIIEIRDGIILILAQNLMIHNKENAFETHLDAFIDGYHRKNENSSYLIASTSKIYAEHIKKIMKSANGNYSLFVESYMKQVIKNDITQCTIYKK